MLCYLWETYLFPNRSLISLGRDAEFRKSLVPHLNLSFLPTLPSTLLTVSTRLRTSTANSGAEALL